VPPVERCINHSFEVAERLCGECGRPFCHLCLVTPFKRGPAMCQQCAVAVAGIRNGARQRRVRSRKEIKAYERERRLAENRPDPSTGQGGFGSAKPALTASPTKPPARSGAAGPAEAADAKPRSDAAKVDGDEERPTPGRNRPLRGLVR
jgi:hypothetical protein